MVERLSPKERLNLAASQPDLEPDADLVAADTGLGTTYERWALNRRLVELQRELDVHSVLEGPGDGMTGIYGLNSLPLALHGAQVTLLVPPSDVRRAAFARQVWTCYTPPGALRLAQCGPVTGQWLGINGDLSTGAGEDPAPVTVIDVPFASGSFDLAWNFNVMTRLPGIETVGRLLAELARVSRRYVLIFVPNRANYGFPLHRLHHHVAEEPWDHGVIELMQPQPWNELFSMAGLRLRRVLWVDCPWWPDIVDLGQLIADFFPFMKSAAHKARPENRYRWPADALPYYRAEAFPQVHRRMQRLAFFEDSHQAWLKQYFAHHVGLLGEKA